MINWIDVMVVKEMRKDELARAAKARLIRQIRGQKPVGRMWYRRWLAHLGDRLITWGQCLKARYMTEQITWNAPEYYNLEGSSDCCIC